MPNTTSLRTRGLGGLGGREEGALCVYIFLGVWSNRSDLNGEIEKRANRLEPIVLC